MTSSSNFLPSRFDLPANHRTIHWLDSTIPHVQAFQAAYGWNLVTNPEQTTSYYISIAARTFVPAYFTPLPFFYFRAKMVMLEQVRCPATSNPEAAPPVCRGDALRAEAPRAVAELRFS